MSKEQHLPHITTESSIISTPLLHSDFNTLLRLSFNLVPVINSFNLSYIILGFSHLNVLGGTLLNPPANSTRKIEIVGDSITSGFGNLIEDGVGDYSSNNTEGTLTYAALTGKAFGTETTVVSL